MAGESGQRISRALVGATGAFTPFTAEPTSAQRVADAHASFYDQVRQGIVYSAMNTTARALTVSLTTTASLAIWNPPNSGVLGVLLTTAYFYGSGTLAAGYIAHALFPGQTAIPGGTALVPTSLLNGSAGGILKAFELATGLSTAQQVRFGAAVGAMTTDRSTTAWTPPNRELIDGAICVAPGTAYGIVSVTGAGSSPTMWFEYAWAEVPTP